MSEQNGKTTPNEGAGNDSLVTWIQTVDDQTQQNNSEDANRTSNLGDSPVTSQENIVTPVTGQGTTTTSTTVQTSSPTYTVTQILTLTTSSTSVPFPPLRTLRHIPIAPNAIDENKTYEWYLTRREEVSADRLRLEVAQRDLADRIANVLAREEVIQGE
ncbi:mucin-2-like [Cotesia glomerata]|uniref:mucin-2-like n=1 Tax=Cotesia glomerata TaxID=32391 RepID=UPI001D01EE9E|nr:mucin-2-like [Cotesia glomerata]